MLLKSILSLILLLSYFSITGQDCVSETIIHRTVNPRLTDQNITPELHEHQIIFNPDCTQKNKLVLHLVGSFDNPANTTYFPYLAANNGFKVISLKYRNNVAARTSCSESTDPDCYKKYRQEIVFGENTSEIVEVDVSNSIMNRIAKLLLHLDEEYPTENWDTFINVTGNIKWENIIVSGHSQGGGHAAYIAKDLEVDRVIMFAAPNDFNDLANAPEGWLALESATEDSLYYAFGNINDEIVDFSKQYEIWESMNIKADSINIAHSKCNFNNYRILYTDYLATGILGPNHGSVIVDDSTPIIDGEPVFSSVWSYMLGICEVINSTTEIGLSNNSVVLYPNPTLHSVSIESQSNISFVEIYDHKGSLVGVAAPNESNFKLDLSEYQGLILLRLHHKKLGTISTKRVFIN